MYQQGGRPELAQQESEEIEIIQSFMPKQLSEDEVKSVVAAIIQESAPDRQGHGQGDGGAESEIRRPDGHGQGRRDGEGAAGVNKRLSMSPSITPRFHDCTFKIRIPICRRKLDARVERGHGEDGDTRSSS